MLRSFVPLLLLPLLFAAGGCATEPPQQTEAPSADELDAMSARERAGASTAPIAERPYSPLDDPSSPLYRKVVYFDYDATSVKPEYADLLRRHAQYIATTDGVRVTLEGHSDERGTREYNLALGDRRADAIKRFMVAEGVPAEQLSTLSYGEERPVDPRRGEGSWAENRRVELVY